MLYAGEIMGGNEILEMGGGGDLNDFFKSRNLSKYRRF